MIPNPQKLHKANLAEFMLHQLFLIATYGLMGRTGDARRVLSETSRFAPEFRLEDAAELLARALPFQPGFQHR